MSQNLHHAKPGSGPWAMLRAPGRQGSVSVLFATCIIALLMVVGMAVDFSFYNEAQTQLNVAADTAAIHAVRIAVEAIQQNQSNYIAQGQTAGLQWFEAQAGNVPQAKFVNTPTVTVSFNTSNNLLTAVVDYTGVIYTHFGGLFPVHWQNWPNWGIAGAATAVQSAETYIEFDMLLDNSSSMLIAADASGIATMDTATPCSTEAAGAGQAMDGTYTWSYNTTGAYGGGNNSSTLAACASSSTYVPYGYGTFSYTGKVNTTGCPTGPKGATTATLYANELVPPVLPVEGACNSGFTGPTSGSGNQCPYMPSVLKYTTIATTTGSYATCVNTLSVPTGGGSGTYYPVSPDTATNPTTGVNNAVTSANVPQAPCAFACHWTSSLVPGLTYSNDYYGLARQNGIQLRFDVVQSAAETVVNDLISYLPSSPVPAPFKVGVYTFSTALGTLYSPPATVTTASAEQTELNNALAAIENYQTPVVSDSPNTDFPDSMASLVTVLTSAGNGSTAAQPRKNLFIVTDGVSDYYNSSGQRILGAIDTTECTAIKNLGVTIYVLYTDYYPLPNYFYLDDVKSFVESTTVSPVAAALQSCASSANTYFQASSSTAIATAMQTMLTVALTSPGRLSE